MAMGEELPWEDIYLESLEDSSSVFGRLDDMKKTRTIILCQIPSGFLRTGNDDPYGMPRLGCGCFYMLSSLGKSCVVFFFEKNRLAK